MILAHHAGYGRQIHVVDQRAERAEDGDENNKYDIVAAVERGVGGRSGGGVLWSVHVEDVGGG